MTAALERACADAVHVIRSDGVQLRAARACLFVLDQIGWRRTACLLSLPPLAWLVELGYWLVARNRMLFSRFFWRA